MWYLSMAVPLALAACRGGSDDRDARAASACVEAGEVVADLGRSAPGTAVAIAAVDDRFDPACVLLDEAGAVTIVVRNDGRHPHNLTTARGDAVSVDAGQVAILETVVVDGSTRYTCTIHPGMDGELRVAASGH